MMFKRSIQRQSRSLFPPSGVARTQRALAPAAGWVLAVFMGGGGGGVAAGQLVQPSTQFENCRVLLPDGRWLDDAVLTVRGERIVSIQGGGQNAADAGRGARPARVERIDLGGATVTAGLIDVSDLIANTAAAGNDASLRAIDAFDRYASDHVEAALRRGITAGFIAPRGGSGINGLGGVVRLADAGSGTFGQVLVDVNSLSVNLGSGDGPITRLATVDSIRKQFQAAREYRESLEIYEEELEEYIRKIKERAAAGEKSESPSGEGERPQPQRPQPQRSRGEGEGEGGVGGGRQVSETSFSEADDAGSDHSEVDGDADQPLQGRPPRPRPPQPEQAEAPAAQPRQGRTDADGIRKPTKPTYSAANESLLRAIDREIPVRFVAHRTEDILNALEIAREFNLTCVIEGGAESGRVARLLADAGVAVVLDYESTGHASQRSAGRLLDENIRALNEHGVAWAFGSGRGAGMRGRFLLMQAQIAQQPRGTSKRLGESPATGPLQLLTVEAARFLGVEDSIGRLSPGALADFVVWTSDPLDPAAHVISVYVGGKRVYQHVEIEGGE